MILSLASFEKIELIRSTPVPCCTDLERRLALRSQNMAETTGKSMFANFHLLLSACYTSTGLERVGSSIIQAQLTFFWSHTTHQTFKYKNKGTPKEKKYEVYKKVLQINHPECTEKTLSFCSEIKQFNYSLIAATVFHGLLLLVSRVELRAHFVACVTVLKLLLLYAFPNTKCISAGTVLHTVPCAQCSKEGNSEIVDRIGQTSAQVR